MWRIMAGSVIVKANQTPLDIAMQKCGSIEKVMELAALNNISPTADLISGQEILHPDAAVMVVSDYFRKYGIYPASATTLVTDIKQGGIEFWSVEFDFITS